MSSTLTLLIGERIRTLRKEKKYTQEFLSEKSGVHITYISDIERGARNISMETLEKILIALDVHPVEVFRIEGIEDIGERADRADSIKALNSLLVGRKPEEVQLVFRLAKDVLNTFDELK